MPGANEIQGITRKGRNLALHLQPGSRIEVRTDPQNALIRQHDGLRARGRPGPGRRHSDAACVASPPASGEALTAGQRQRIQSDGKDASGYRRAECRRKRQGRAGFDRGDHALYDSSSQSGLRGCANINDARLADNGARSGEAQPHRDFDDLRRIRLRRLPALRNTLPDLGRQVDRWRALARACHAVCAHSNKTRA